MKPALATRASRLRTPSKSLWKMVLGCLPGDASISCPRGVMHPRLHFVHGTKQSEYCRHKAGLLADYVRTPPKIETNRGWGKEVCRFSTVTSPVFGELWATCIRRDGDRPRKTVTRLWVDQLDWRSVAYWFMDDGSSQRGVASFSTHGFREHEVAMLAARLTQLGATANARPVRHGTRNYWVIRLGVPATRTLFEHVRPYVVPSMAYKLGPSIIEPHVELIDV